MICDFGTEDSDAGNARLLAFRTLWRLTIPCYLSVFYPDCQAQPALGCAGQETVVHQYADAFQIWYLPDARHEEQYFGRQHNPSGGLQIHLEAAKFTR